MKYTYAYKTSDGTRHEDSIIAASRDVAFTELRKRGIRPIKVVAADGSKSNGELRGVRKRILAAAVVLAAAVAASVVYVLLPERIVESRREARTRNALALARQMIPGSREKIREAVESAFENPADRFLAHFAEPGRVVTVARADAPTVEAFERATREMVRISEDDFTETVDLKRIVTKMKDELRRYLSGGGSVECYLDALFERQKTEVSRRSQSVSRLDELLSGDASAAYDYWLKANAQLQSMGIYPIPLPDRLRKFTQTSDFGGLEEK